MMDDEQGLDQDLLFDLSLAVFRMSHVSNLVGFTSLGSISHTDGHEWQDCFSLLNSVLEFALTVLTKQVDEKQQQSEMSRVKQLTHGIISMALTTMQADLLWSLDSLIPAESWSSESRPDPCKLF